MGNKLEQTKQKPFCFRVFRVTKKGTREMNANELADALQETEPYYSTDYKLFDKAATMLRQQQAEIEALNYDLDGFKQNFFVSGFHLQIKMANEQLLKQQEQIDALKSELDRAVELYTDKAIKVEQLEKELTEAGGMIGVLREYISDLEKGLDSSINLNKAQAERNNEQ
jgi:multidrug resistance efflux pump